LNLAGLARASLANRAAAVGLAVATVALAVGLVVLVEQLRMQVRDSFHRSVSGIDLIVGAPTSPVQLLLFSVFGIGSPMKNLDHADYRRLADDPAVDWAVPLSVGDAYRGRRVVGTTTALFEHYRYAGGRPLEFAAGRAFDDLFDVVAGARVARALGLGPGDPVVLDHGGGNVSLHRHEAQPFTVSGVLAATGTPVDDALFVSLAAQRAIHVGWERGVPRPGSELGPERARALHDDHELEPESVSAVLLGLKTRAAALAMQYRINQQADAGLLAILPGLALQQLWRITGLVENVLRVVSGLVVIAGLLGVLTVLLTTLNERRREMAILRACGARPWQIAALLLLEAALIMALGLVLGLALAWIAQATLAPWLLQRFGLVLGWAAPAAWQWAVLAAIGAAGVLVALLPAALAYRRTLADGMQVRL